MSTVVNAEQVQRWNGDTARRWIAQRERHASVRERLTPHLLRAAAVSPGDRVLDVGCGCGETTVAVARSAGPDGGVLGLDLSGPMQEVACRLAAEAGVANLRFVQGDAQVYPLPPAAFDLVISSFGVMFFDDPAAAFGNLRTALRPGGRLAFLCWQDALRNEVFAIALRAFMRHAQLPAAVDDDLFADPRRVIDLLGGAGFTDIRVAAVHERARIGSDFADVMGYVRSTSKVRELMARLGDEVLARRVLATMAEEFAARQDRDGVWVRAAAWLVTAGSG
ncbi:class I SAM-dependent methyltransferase [Planosporangium thailandense]|uniref:Class I SAM-dependent methyltransferase n=1 Tax=Planosporangium thailandense TaxID=765197 RepID=A0ABX0XX41_9ACTN|nr:class I SAM-dependent methyltransferase [Planosporangium thailandense]NJC70619.1 class I SAM-dependent methyltransferase [Planosporangium thailandense]